MIDFDSRDSHVEEDRRATLVAKANGLSKSPNEESRQGRISAMSAAMLSIGGRINYEVGGGELDFAVAAGKRATTFELLIDKDALLNAILEPMVSVDTTITELKATCARILERGFNFGEMQKAVQSSQKR